MRCRAFLLARPGLVASDFSADLSEKVIRGMTDNVLKCKFNGLNAIQQGILTPSTKSRLEELEAAKEDLEVRVANEKMAKPKLTAEMALERTRP